MLTKEQIEKINSYYEVTAEEKGTFLFPPIFINEIGSEKRARLDHKAFLTFGDRTINSTNIQECLKNGTAIEVTRRDMILAYTDITYDEYDTKQTNTDKRTRDYLDKIIVNAGYIESIDGEEADKKYERVIVEDKSLDVRKLENGRYAIYEGQFIPPDDYCEILFVFNRIPTKEDLKTIKKVDLVRHSFLRGIYKEKFKCWECGIEVKHWLDLSGSFEEKIDKLDDGYCGC